MADKYWELANLVTGFVAAQTVVFFLALGSQRDFVRSVVKHDGILTIVAILLFGGLYFYTVSKCYQLEIKLRKEADPEVKDNCDHPLLKTSKRARTGRYIWIILFTALSVLAVIMNLIDPPPMFESPGIQGK